MEDGLVLLKKHGVYSSPVSYSWMKKHAFLPYQTALSVFKQHIRAWRGNAEANPDDFIVVNKS